MNPRFVPVLVLAATAASQLPLPSTAGLTSGDWLVPIHTHADDPIGGAYGLWAAGPDYKVKFDDGMTFYPVLGRGYPENLPLRWRTAAITAGGQVLVDAHTAARSWHDARRYELRYPLVTEAYDVRTDGVEQTFVLARRPAAPGDLEVHGRLETPLSVMASPLGTAGIDFVDRSGAPIVCYGRAVAIDAAGRRYPVATTVAGDRLTLTVAGEHVAGAAYPLVIDPLVGRYTLHNTPDTIVEHVSIGRDDTNNRIMVAFGRWTAANDLDTWAYVLNDNFSQPNLVFSDVSVVWRSGSASVAYVRGADRWLIAFQRHFGTSAAVRVYFHDAASLVANSGLIRSVNAPAGFHDGVPSVGGHNLAGDARGYVAFQRDPAPHNTGVSRVMGAPIDAAARTIGGESNLHTDGSITDYDADWPSITQDAGGLGSWIAVWQEYNRANAMDDWDVLSQRVSRNGTLAGSAALGHSGTASRHKLHPHVAGSDGRYLVSYLMRDNDSPNSSSFGNEIAVQRFDWSEAAAAPTKLPPQTVVVDASNRFLAALTRPIAYDNNTDSHWALAYRDDQSDLYVARLGYLGRTVETASVYAFQPAASNEAVCYNDDSSEFYIAYSLDNVNRSVLIDRLRYFATANASPFGAGCRGTAIATNAGPNNQPYAGSEFFRIDLSSAAPAAPTALFVSTAPTQIPIGGGCFLHLAPATMVQVAVSLTNPFGNWSVPFPLLDSVRTADLYWQFFQIDGSTLVSSNGLHTAIR